MVFFVWESLAVTLRALRRHDISLCTCESGVQLDIPSTFQFPFENAAFSVKSN